jgi:hypothetical protein
MYKRSQKWGVLFMGMEKDKPVKIGQNTLLVVYVSISLRQGFGCTFPIIGFCDEGC